MKVSMWEILESRRERQDRYEVKNTQYTGKSLRRAGEETNI